MRRSPEKQKKTISVSISVLHIFPLSWTFFRDICFCRRILFIRDPSKSLAKSQDNFVLLCLYLLYICPFCYVNVGLSCKCFFQTINAANETQMRMIIIEIINHLWRTRQVRIYKMNVCYNGIDRSPRIRGLLVVNRSKGQRVKERGINREIRAVGISVSSQYYIR